MSKPLPSPLRLYDKNTIHIHPGMRISRPFGIPFLVDYSVNLHSAVYL
jgi:hypothetical protein